MNYIKNIFTKQALLTGLLVMCVVFLFGYSSYALFMRVDRYDTNQAMSFGELGVSFARAPYSGIPNHIALLNATPMSDEEATKSDYDENKFAFALTNYGLELSDYKVYLVDLALSDLKDATSSVNLINSFPHEYIKVKVDDGKIMRLSEIKDGLIATGEVSYGEENIIYHELRVWISSDYPGKMNEINLKLTFDSVLQSENQRLASLSHHVLLNNDIDAVKSKVPSSLNDIETGDNSGLFYDKYSDEYYFRGNVENNNLIFGTDAEGNDIKWKILSFNDEKMKIVLNNGTIIQNLKTTGNGLEYTVMSWYDNFFTSEMRKMLFNSEKPYGTLEYVDLNRSGIVKDKMNNSFYLDAKINYWVLNGKEFLKYVSKNGLISANENETNYVLPTVYINGKLPYIKGDGSNDAPYQFSLFNKTEEEAK